MTCAELFTKLVTERPAGHSPTPLGEIITRARSCDSGLLAGTKVAVVHFAVIPDQADDALDRAALEFEQVLDVWVFAGQVCPLRGITGDRLVDAQLFGQDHPPHRVVDDLRPLGVVLWEHRRQGLVAELPSDDLEVCGR